MASVPRREILQLYKSLLRESYKFYSYNYRNYAIRRIRSAFKESKNMTDQQTILAKVGEGRNTLGIIKRQVIIGNMYAADKLVIENVSRKSLP